jgi:hypothetical protein
MVINPAIEEPGEHTNCKNDGPTNQMSMWNSRDEDYKYSGYQGKNSQNRERT